MQMQQKYEQASQDETTAESCWYDACDRSARHECLQLCSLMYRKLPVELRDLIYKYLCIEDRPIPAGPYYHFRHYGYSMFSTEPNTALENALSRGRTKIDHTQSPDPDILQPWSHIFHPAYVSLAVASETRKLYFTNNTFSLCNVERGITTFLGGHNYRRIALYRSASGNEHTNQDTTSDISLDPKPLLLVRRLQVRIKCEHAETMLRHELPESMARYREMFANECNFLRLTRNSLEPLLHLPQQEQPLELELIIMTTFASHEGAAASFPEYSDQHRQFINILQAIRNTVYKLMYDCGHTTIKIIQHDEHLSPFPRNLTALWSLTREQWEYEKLANHGRVMWDADFYLTWPGMSAEETYGRFQGSEALALLRERWGISDAFRDTRPKWPIVEGRYWPVGNGPPGCWW